MSNQDELDTNFLNTDNPALILGQDVAATIVAEEAIKRGLKKTFTKEITEETAEGAVKRRVFRKAPINLGGKRIVSSKIAKKISKKVAVQQLKAIAASVRALVRKMILKVTGKQATKAAAGAAAKAGTAVAAGCLGGPAGCAAGAALAAADQAFMAINLLLTLLDPYGVQVIFHQDFIESMATTFKDAMDKGFAEAGFEDYFEEEILFTPEDFVFSVNNETGEIDLTKEWGPRYNELVDEYMSKKGIKPGWRDVLEKEAVEYDASGVKSEISQKTKSFSENQVRRNVLVILLVLIFGVLMWYIFFR